MLMNVVKENINSSVILPLSFQLCLSLLFHSLIRLFLFLQYIYDALCLPLSPLLECECLGECVSACACLLVLVAGFLLLASITLFHFLMDPRESVPVQGQGRFWCRPNIQVGAPVQGAWT